MSAMRDQYADKINLVLFEPLQLDEPWKLETYRQIGGYEAGRRSSREAAARTDHRAGQGVGPARTRRRGLSRPA